MPLVFIHTRHFKSLALVLLVQLAAWSRGWAIECEPNAICDNLPNGDNCVSSPHCCFSMREEEDIGVDVGNVNIVTDINNALTNGTGTISLNGENPDFELNETTGVIRMKSVVDRDLNGAERLCLSISVDLMLINGGSTVIRIGVIVEDINDNSPTFVSDNTPFSLVRPEGTEVRVCIRDYPQLEATDMDASPNGDITYSLGGETRDKFEIDNENCIVNVVELDREEISDPSNTAFNPVRLVLIATDNGTRPNQANTTFTINISDVNDNNPVFTEASLETVTILENTDDDVVIRDLNATDRDYNNVLTFSLLSNTNTFFTVDRDTGKLSVSTNGVGLTPATHHLQVVVSDGVSEHDVMRTLQVDVQDFNVEASIFLQGMLLNGMAVDTLQEEMDPSKLEILYRVVDGDVGNIYLVKLSGEHTENFTASYKQGMDFGLISINLSYPIDQEALVKETQSSIITLRIAFTEISETNNVTQCLTFNITVVGINDNAPFLNGTEFEAKEERSGLIGELQGLDLDSGKDGEVETYCVVSAVGFPNSPSNLTAKFKERNPCHQRTLLSPPLDREAGIDTIVVTMNLTDSGNKSLSNLVNVTIRLIDINDNYPFFPEVPERGYKIQVAENKEPGIVGSVIANDADIGTNEEIVYELLNDQDKDIFSIDSTTGEVSALVMFDRETRDKYTIRVKAVNVAEMAADARNLRDEVEVEITITDENDNAPEWETQSNSFTTSSNVLVGTLVIQLAAKDEDLNSDISYEIDPSVLFNVSKTGAIRVAADLTDKIDSYDLLLSANDGSHTTRRNITITVGKPTPSPPSQVPVIGTVVGVIVLVVVVTIAMVVVLSCLYFYHRRHSVKLSKRNGRFDTDGVNSPTRGILRQIPSTSSGATSRNSSATSNGRGVKFEPTVQKFGYDHEHAVNNNSVLYVTQSSIRLDSSGSGDESPMTPPRLSASSHHSNGKLPLDGHSHMSNGAPRLPPIQEDYLYAPHHPMRHSHHMQDDAYSDEDSEGNSDDDSTLPDNASSTNAPLPSVRHLSRMASSPHSTSPNSHLGPLLPMPQISPSHQFSRSPEHSSGLNPPRHDELSIHSTSSESLTVTLPPVHTHLAHENQRLSRPSGRSSYPVHMPDGYIMPPSSSSRYGRDSFMDRFGGTDFEDNSTYASADLDEALHFRPDQEPGIFSLTATSSYDEESQL